MTTLKDIPNNTPFIFLFTYKLAPAAPCMSCRSKIFYKLDIVEYLTKSCCACYFCKRQFGYYNERPVHLVYTISI